MTGDYQPAEGKYGISRQMLGVCLNLGFPVFVLERSPLVLRDLDLLKEINACASSVVAFSIITTPESPGYEEVNKMEGIAPPSQKRFEAMRTLSGQGILTGTCFMPILPGLCDNDANLEAVVRWTADHGGKFVIASSLTLTDQQKSYFLQVLAEGFPDLLRQYQELYPSASYGPHKHSWSKTARRIRELCQSNGISDRIPRPINPGDKLALNKRVAEKLANTSHEMEIDQKPQYRIWAYRKAAWAVEDLEQDIGSLYRAEGLEGLQSIPNVGSLLGERVEKLVAEITEVSVKQLQLRSRQ